MVTTTSINKFIDRMGIVVKLESHLSGSGSLCVKITAKFQNKVQYYIVDCFKQNKDGRVVWVDSEPLLFPKDGIFAYFGDHNAIDNYFLDLTTEYAQNWFESNK